MCHGFMTHPFFFHRISRMNQRLSCLSDYSRNFAEFWPLANGWRPICAAVVFGHADFADDADFSSWDYFVPQISQIYTDFFHRKVFHRISRMNQRQSCLSDYSRIFADIWPLANGSRPIYAPVVFLSRRFRK